MLARVEKNLREKRQESESVNTAFCPTENKQSADCKEMVICFDTND